MARRREPGFALAPRARPPICNVESTSSSLRRVRVRAAKAASVARPIELSQHRHEPTQQVRTNQHVARQVVGWSIAVRECV